MTTSDADDATARASFSIIVPTKGRATLARTVGAVASQIKPGDEIIIICNDKDRVGNWGRNRGQQKATASHLLYCDDDDVFLPGALETIRRWADANPGRIGLFRRRFNARVAPQWRVRELIPSNVQSMCMCIPNVPGKVPEWGPSGKTVEEQRALPPWSDVMFVEMTARLQATDWVWVDAVIGHERPETHPVRRLRYWLAPRARLNEVRRRT
jgi:glycosyltransferase involved in cell wall biosynthesis